MESNKKVGTNEIQWYPPDQKLLFHLASSPENRYKLQPQKLVTKPKDKFHSHHPINALI